MDSKIKEPQKLSYHQLREIIKQYLQQDDLLKGVRDILNVVTISINEIGEEVGRRVRW